MSSLSLFCPSTGSHEDAMTSWQDTMARPWDIRVDATTQGEDAGFLRKCDKAWRETDATIIGFLHSDLYINENGWDDRVRMAFDDDPNVAVVGFVGATGLADEAIYKVPYAYTQLARNDVWSNLTDWEAHGNLLEGSKDAAVIDSCAVFCRRSLLERVDGFPVGRYPNSSHCSDLWLCCVAHRLGHRVTMLGVKCTHKGGGKGQAGTEWLDARGSDWVMHQRAHELIYDDFRDVLPIWVRS